MITYQVQKGDTVSRVTKLLGISFQELRRLNPQAVAKSPETGKWYIREGALLRGAHSFHSILLKEQQADMEGGGAGSAAETDAKPGTKADPPAPASPSAPSVAGGAGGEWKEYTIRRGDTIWDLAVNRFRVPMDDIIRDNSIRDPRAIQPGQKIRIRPSSRSEARSVVASWYGEAYHGKTMANGKPFNMHASTIAHKTLPFGTKVELENPETGDVVRATVTDRGPFVKGRDVDLSYGLARKLSLLEKGVGKLILRVI